MTRVYQVALTGAQVPIPTGSEATGTGLASFDETAEVHRYRFTVEGLDRGTLFGNPNGAPPGTEDDAATTHSLGPVVLDLNTDATTKPLAADGNETIDWIWMASEGPTPYLTSFEATRIGTASEFYVDIRTTAFPEGEIRSQPIASADDADDSHSGGTGAGTARIDAAGTEVVVTEAAGTGACQIRSVAAGVDTVQEDVAAFELTDATPTRDQIATIAGMTEERSFTIALSGEQVTTPTGSDAFGAGFMLSNPETASVVYAITVEGLDLGAIPPGFGTPRAEDTGPRDDRASRCRCARRERRRDLRLPAGRGVAAPSARRPYDPAGHAARSLLRHPHHRLPERRDPGPGRLLRRCRGRRRRGNGGQRHAVRALGDDTRDGGGVDVFACLAADAPGTAPIVDISKGDELALDDRLFGLSEDDVDPRQVTQQQIAAALRPGVATYERNTQALTVDTDGRRGPGDPEVIAIFEGMPRLGPNDILLF